MILEPKQQLNSKPKKRSIDKMNAGNSNFSNGRKRSQRLLLLALALGMAMVSVMLLHKLREGRMFGLMLQDQDRQISTLQLILRKEREKSKEIKRKLEDLKAKNFLMRIQKIELANKLEETQTAGYQLQNKMETTLDEKQNQIKGLADKEEELMRTNLRVREITELLKQREAEVEEMKQQLEKLCTPVNNTIPQDGTKDNPANSSEVRGAGEVKGEENEDTPKEGKWVKFQNNVDDEPLKDGGEEASHDHQNDNPTTSQENENKLEVEVKEQSEELKNGEGKIDKKEKKEQWADKAGETEINEEGTTEVKEQNTEPKNDQETSYNQEKKDAVVAQDGKENSQSGNENQVTPKELTIDAEGRGHKARRNKNRGKGRRRRKATTSIREDSRYVTKENNKGEGENQERDTINPKIPEGSQIEGSLNSEGQTKSEATEETREHKTVTSDQQLENAQNQGDGEGGSEAQGDSINRTVEGEENKITSTKEQSEKAENPQVDEAKNENSDNKTPAAPNLDTENVDNAEKQDGVVKEEADVATTSVPRHTDPDNAATGDEGSKVQEGDSIDNNVESEESEIASKEKQSGKSENLQEDEAKSENNNNETGASAEANSNTENQRDDGKQDADVKKETDVNTASITEQQGDVNIESITEKPDTDNAADDQQTKVSEINTSIDDGSSVDENHETKDEEDTA